MTDEMPARPRADPTFEHRRREEKRQDSGRDDREEWVWVLDYLPYGRETDKRPVYQKKPLIHALGDNKLILMELIPIEGKIPPIHIKTHIGTRDEEYVERVKSRIAYDDLSHGAVMELPPVLEDYIMANEDRFIQFFSKAEPLSMRQNSLELLPGVGKKLMLDVLEESKKGPFADFADLKTRVPALHNPEKLLVQRIIEEMKGGQKYYLFAAQPSKSLTAPRDEQGENRPRRDFGHGGNRHDGSGYGGNRSDGHGRDGAGRSGAGHTDGRNRR
jgi:Predicted RNA-binding protein